jgi:CIC family chloride channel protein
MLATVIAGLIAAAIMGDSIMTEKLTRRGLRVPSDYHADILHTTLVRDVMTTHVETVRATARLAEVAKRFHTDGHGAYPLVDDQGRCVGIITRGDLLREENWSDDSLVTDAAARDVVSITSTETVGDALDRILQEDVEHLPVIDDRTLVGICTRTDIIRARRTQWVHEQTEPGWRRRTRGANES